MGRVRKVVRKVVGRCWEGGCGGASGSSWPLCPLSLKLPRSLSSSPLNPSHHFPLLSAVTLSPSLLFSPSLPKPMTVVPVSESLCHHRLDIYFNQATL